MSYLQIFKTIPFTLAFMIGFVVIEFALSYSKPSISILEVVTKLPLWLFVTAMLFDHEVRKWKRKKPC